MWQKAKFIYCEEERHKFLLGKTCWVRAKQPDTAPIRFRANGLEIMSKLIGGPAGYSTNIYNDNDPALFLGVAPDMVELLSDFEENPAMVPYSSLIGVRQCLE